MEPLKDERLWKIARKRAAFRKNLYLYLVIISFFWIIWWLTSVRQIGVHAHPWPIWPMVGWGIGLALQYFNAYNGSSNDMAEEEYERLKRQQHP